MVEHVQTSATSKTEMVVPGVAIDRSAREYLSFSRWACTLIGLATVLRTATGVLSFFLIGPLLGAAAYPVWGAMDGLYVVEWVLAAELTVAGLVVAIRARFMQNHRKVQIAVWFLIADTVFYLASIAVALVPERDSADSGWWKLLVAVMVANAALLAMAVKVIRKASVIHRSRP